MADRREVMEQQAVRDASPDYSVEAGAASAEDVPPGYKRTEVGVIPKDWELSSIGDLLSFTNGLNKAKRFFGYGTPIVNYMDVYRNTELRVDTIESLVSLSKAELKAFDVRHGDVFFTRTSETPDEIGLSAVMLDKPADTVFSGFVLRGRPTTDQLDDGFKKYCFSSSTVRSQIIAKATYTTRALTNGRALSTVSIPVPPIQEQRAIATALSDADALLESLDRLIAKKRAIKQAAMQQLLTGQTRLPGFTGEWETKRLGDIADLHRRGVSPAMSPDEPFQHFSLPAFDENRAPTVDLGKTIGSNKFRVPDKAVLVSKLNPRIPRVWKPDSIGSNAVASTEFLLFTPREGVSRDFLYVLCCSPMFAEQMELLVTGTTGSHQRISPASALKIDVKLPLSASEQLAIATVLSDMDTEIEALEHRRDKARQIKQGMMQQLLTGRVRLVQIKGSNGSESSGHTDKRAKGCTP